MRPCGTIGAFQRAIAPTSALVKIGSPVSAFTPCRSLSPCAVAEIWAPAIQIIDSRPPPVVVAMGEPLPMTLPHHAVATPDPALMRSATRPLVPEHDVPFAATASTVPEGVAM